MLKIINGKLITDRILEADLYVEHGKIAAITSEALPCDQVIDAEGAYVSPGFIDLHVHGGGGADFMDGGVEPILQAAKTHRKHGTTTIYPTTITAPMETVKRFFADVRTAAAQPDMPHIGGVHMEGPYIADSQAGAQDRRFITDPVPADYEELVAAADGILKRWAYAPERPGSEAFSAYIQQHGIVPAIGHSDAAYEDVMKAYECGVRNMTHFYSGMSGLTRRDGYRVLGTIETGYLLDDMNVEVIADGIHLPPELLRLIYKGKGKDRICLITDAMRGADMPEGDSMIGPIGNGVPCIIEGGIAKMPDRTCFAGSVATTDRLVRTFHKMAGGDLVSCVQMVTKNPAAVMGLTNVGQLKVGYDADLLIFDEDINVGTVILKNGDDVNIYHN